jgi:hypothetical protein
MLAKSNQFKMKFSMSIMRLLLTAIAIFGIVNYTSAQAHDNVIDNPGIPPEFSTVKSHVLVVLYDDNSALPPHAHKIIYKKASEHVQELFPQNYTGGFAFVTMSTDIDDNTDYELHLYDHDRSKFTVTNPAYKNVDSFRFVLYDVIIGLDDPIPHFGIYDRKLDKCYTAGGQYLPVGKWYIESFAKKMDELRVK